MTAWDAIIVGAGSAGSVLAARLSEDPNWCVLVLESGPIPRSKDLVAPRLLDASLVAGASPTEPLAWHYQGELVDNSGANFRIIRGRTLGGSGAINGSLWFRPRRCDFERWSRQGGPGWSQEAVLPAMRAMETDLNFGATAIHGGTGATPVQRTSLDGALAVAMSAASERLGYSFETDKNGDQDAGFGAVPRSVRGDKRCYSGLTHLLPALSRENLTVVDNATVIALHLDRDRVCGVSFRTAAGEVRRVDAGEVVLCAGPIASAQLLLLAGIGPADQLRAAGLPIVVDAPGVGSGFSDHPQLSVTWNPTQAPEADPGQWALGALHTEEFELLQAVRPYSEFSGGAATAGDPLPMLITDLRPRASGRLELDPADPRQAPLLRYGYLRSADDQRVFREAVRVVMAVLAEVDRGAREPAIIGLSGEVLADDRALDAWIAANIRTAFHTCATVPLGTGNQPVDPLGKVRGVQGLRVADTSILPDAPTRGPAMAAELVAELVAADIRGLH